VDLPLVTAQKKTKKKQNINELKGIENTLKLTEIRIVSHVISQSVFQPSIRQLGNNVT